MMPKAERKRWAWPDDLKRLITLSQSGRLMGILRSVVLILLLAVLDTGQHFRLGGTIAFQSVSDNYALDIPQPFE
jgi:hypothetical protein